MGSAIGEPLASHTNLILLHSSSSSSTISSSPSSVPAGSASRRGEYCDNVLHQARSPTPFYSVLLSVSLFMDVSNVFHSLNPPDNPPDKSLLSYSVLPVVFILDWSFQLFVNYISLYESLPSPDMIRSG